jgi:riboflavin kinase
MKLAELGALDREIPITTSMLAKNLRVSQQTASRQLLKLEEFGLVKRLRSGRRDRVVITSEGNKVLAQMYANLKQIFEGPKREIVIYGTVFSGLGEGRYYVSQPGYRKQFREKLGFNPYPGTLNLRLGREHLSERQILESFSSILIYGYDDGYRRFGAARCYKARINDKIEGAIVTAFRTQYGPDVLEIIAPLNLRRKLKLRDGDLVKIRVQAGT